MRKDKVYPKEWALLWKEVEDRMTELEKKLTYSPNRDLVGASYLCGCVVFVCVCVCVCV